ncbi:hypothetical protein LTR84_002741 [Exophiala bonariae]|uniref:Transcription factor domain-containing protein n=1 Tax=Exophiala bonariae TaxID=1690606 RepID=A0AAV9NC92_9EURO|nr:hypothetical protein LTR84_002741 [Exophiala bonariae]
MGASHSNVQTLPNEPSFSFSAFEDTFPSLFESVDGGPHQFYWNPSDSDLLSAFWDPPTSEAEHWFYDIDHSDFDSVNQTGLSSDELRIESSVGWIQDHFRRRSHSSSPLTNEAKKLWYSAPPRLQLYDKEVLNVLLNIARRHVATTFKLFADFEAKTNTSHELCLAMAAIGALFLGVDCGITVAKTLYNDARRIHFENFHSNGVKSSFQAASSSVKTFILLTIYGISSGDKRSYEFVEAFHVSMIQAMRYCCQFVPTELTLAETEELSLISEAMEIIQCYNVLLLQRPPQLSPIHLLESMMTTSTVGLGPLFDCSHEAERVTGSIREVANLGAYTWASNLRGQEQTRQWQLWRPELIELGLERWLKAKRLCPTTTDLSSMTLYHMSYLQLNVNLGLLQLFACGFATDPKVTKEGNFHEGLKTCTSGRSFEAALWHAKTMIQEIKGELEVVEPDRSNLGISKRRILEPPHLAYCIYFSILVVWCGECVSTGLLSLARDSCIKDGIQILDMLKIRVAKVLRRALCELLQDALNCLPPASISEEGRVKTAR